MQPIQAALVALEQSNQQCFIDCPIVSKQQDMGKRARDSVVSRDKNTPGSAAMHSSASGHNSSDAYSGRASRTETDQPRGALASAMACAQCPPPARSMCGIGSMTSMATVKIPPHKLFNGVPALPVASFCNCVRFSLACFPKFPEDGS